MFIHRVACKEEIEVDVQLQEGEVCVAVVCLALALLHDIVLEDARRLRVVAIQSIEDLLHVLGPFRREVKGDAHDCCVDERRGVGVGGLVKFAQCEPVHWPTHYQPRVIFKKVRPRQKNQGENIHRAYTPTNIHNMAPYDSDSSDGGEDYTETNVLLGYATKDATGDAISHVGGAPVCIVRMRPRLWLRRCRTG